MQPVTTKRLPGPRAGSSLLRWNALQRLLAAAGLAILLWLAVWWALRPGAAYTTVTVPSPLSCYTTAEASALAATDMTLRVAPDGPGGAGLVPARAEPAGQDEPHLHKRADVGRMVAWINEGKV